MFELDFTGPTDFGPPMIVEVMHALREAGVSRMTLMVHGNHDRRRVILCDVRPAKGVRCTARWRQQAVTHRTPAVKAVYEELRQQFVVPEQAYEDFYAKFVLKVDTGTVRVSDVRFLKPHYAFEGWQRRVTLR